MEHLASVRSWKRATSSRQSTQMPWVPLTCRALAITLAFSSLAKRLLRHPTFSIVARRILTFPRHSKPPQHARLKSIQASTRKDMATRQPWRTRHPTFERARPRAHLRRSTRKDTETVLKSKNRATRLIKCLVNRRRKCMMHKDLPTIVLSRVSCHSLSLLRT